MTAGVTAGVLEATGFDQATKSAFVDGKFDVETFAKNLQINIQRNAVSTAINTVAEGGDLSDALKNTLISSAVNTIGAEIAGEIGKAAKAKNINTGVQYIAHAALGCGIAAATNADCGAGAAGAVIGEVVGEIYENQNPYQEALAEDVLEMGNYSSLPEAERQMHVANFYANWKAKGVDFARLASAVAVFAAGGDTNDVNAAANTGGNAAENNALETGWDIASLAMGLYELDQAIEGGDWVDIVLAGGAVFVDGAAILLPGIPGGAGAALKLTKETVENLPAGYKALQSTETALKNSDLPTGFIHVADEAGNIKIAAPDGKIYDNKVEAFYNSPVESLSKIDDYVDLVGFRKEHILNRHKYGANKPKKTEFPESWSDERVLHNISDIATDPNARRVTSSHGTQIYGVRDGIEIRVDLYPSNHPKYPGQISTGYPVAGPNIPINP